MDGEAKLLQTTYNKDELGQQMPVIRSRPVLVTVKSIGQSESFKAGQAGLNPDIRLDVSMYDYDGEKEVQFMGNTYTVYRNFTRFEDETIELYLTKKAGNG